MQETSDNDLLQQYAKEGAEEAFAALVTRHVHLVYFAALRKTGNPHAAEEITQAVFIILAKKAAGLSQKTILPGWLYQTTRLTAASFLRDEIRRTRREQEAYMESLSHEPESEIWPEIAPLLEDAMSGLGEKDRNAIVLRFFRGKSFAEVGAAFGASENAAKKRVAYALEKLRKFFARRGVASTTVIIAGAISTNSVHAAPAALATTATAAALARGAAAGSSTATLIKAALKIMAWSKVKTAVVIGAGVLFAAGTSTITVKAIQHHRSYYAWQDVELNPQTLGLVLANTSPQVTILPSKKEKRNSRNMIAAGYQLDEKDVNSFQSIGLDIDLKSIVNYAYHPAHYLRMAVLTDLPQEKYDFISNLRHDSARALREEVKRQFGLIGKTEMRETDVFVLKAANPDARNSKTKKGAQNGGNTLSHLINSLEAHFKLPILDETGLTNEDDFTFDWPVQRTADVAAHNEVVKETLRNQLSLELVPERRVIEMLVVRKMK